jgi:hypothetical protein
MEILLLLAIGFFVTKGSGVSEPPGPDEAGPSVGSGGRSTSPNQGLGGTGEGATMTPPASGPGPQPVPQGGTPLYKPPVLFTPTSAYVAPPVPEPSSPSAPAPVVTPSVATAVTAPAPSATSSVSAGSPTITTEAGSILFQVTRENMIAWLNDSVGTNTYRVYEQKPDTYLSGNSSMAKSGAMPLRDVAFSGPYTAVLASGYAVDVKNGLASDVYGSKPISDVINQLRIANGLSSNATAPMPVTSTQLKTSVYSTYLR